MSFRPQRAMPNNQKKNKPSKGGKRRAGAVTSVPKFFRPGPIVQYVDMAYSSIYGLVEPALNTGTIGVFSLSSVYDPDVSGVGTSALGYTGYNGFFTRYRVIRARVIINVTPTVSGAVMVGYMIGPNSNTTSAANLWPVQTNSYQKMINGSTPGGTHGMLSVNRVVDLSKVQGVTKQQFMTDLDYSAAFGSSPARQTYLLLCVRGLGSVPGAATFDVRIVYHTELSQPYQAVTN